MKHVIIKITVSGISCTEESLMFPKRKETKSPLRERKRLCTARRLASTLYAALSPGGGGVPHPVPTGYPNPVLMETGGYPHPAPMGGGVPPSSTDWGQGTPILTRLGTPLVSWMGVLPSARWGYSSIGGWGYTNQWWMGRGTDVCENSTFPFLRNAGGKN